MNEQPLTPQPQQPPVGADGPAAVLMADQFPLLPTDPVRVGDFWLDARLTATRAGTAYAAHEEGGDTVMLLHLAEGAAGDAAARARFAGEINAMHIDTVVARGGEGQDDGRMAVRYRAEADDPTVAEHAPLAPWAVLAFDGSPTAVAEAARVLHAVDLERTPPLGRPSGPDYRLHWSERTSPGTTRLWPLPWPGRRDRAGWISILSSWLLMLLVAALAVLMAILLFQNQPPVMAPAPIPSSGSATGSASPSSASSSAQPSESGSGSPIQSPGDANATRSDSPSMSNPSGTQSGPAEPSPNKKL